MKVFTDEEWDYLCSKINFGASFMDTRAIQIFNKPSVKNDKDTKYHITTVRSAVEFGFKGCESGYNLQKVLVDFDKLMRYEK